jgi:eukaryotic-like serine/threonine-protein kinase
MDDPSPTNCPRCGAPISAGQANPPCAACLLSGALATPESPGVSGEPAEFPRCFGEYRLLGVLGAGGMGTVYEAEQLVTGRRVALKMLSQQLDSVENRQRFFREGRLAASINHPNSLYVFGSEEIESTPVITMEIASGGTLKDELEKRGPFPVAKAVDAILDVISGLEAALAGEVLHRDVKPSNCFVDLDGSVKVGDFGLSVSTLAKDDSYATASGVIMGTPAYAAPEQLRGDELDVRADIYSVGATLFTLLSGRAPFEGKNAVQVVANAVNQKVTPISELREDVPPGLERALTRCLAKEPEGRYGDYLALRDVLLPFGSKKQEPASMTMRASAGWIDYLIAFLIPYVPLMLSTSGEEFHVQFFLEPNLYATRYYLACFGFAFLYFALVEGIWGAGLGKRLKGLRVIRKNGRSPGVGRALIRILLPVLACEGIRIPLMMLSISSTEIDQMTTSEVVLFFVAAFACPWIPVLLALRARRENGFATAWDLASGTRVVVKPGSAERPPVEPTVRNGVAVESVPSFGPYRFVGEVALEEWIVAIDPVLRRQVWLLRRTSPELSPARENLARSGRLRWLQEVEARDETWDAFEASEGTPFSRLVLDGERVPWGTMRHWLHDLASELWAAKREGTLPAELSLDQVWITARGNAILLDRPWPDVEAPAEHLPVADEQRFLNAVAAHVDSTGLPLHARPVLRNLENGRFEKLSFLTGVLRGLLDRPAEVGAGIRAGSVFVLPLYAWIMFFVGARGGDGPLVEALGTSAIRLALSTGMLVLFFGALSQILALPFRTTAGHSVFRLAVVNARGEPARVSELLIRWALVWLPLFMPVAAVALFLQTDEAIALVSALTLLLLWIGVAVHTAIHPNRGLHDRLAGTWVVRR